ncbi:AAA ATPase-like protein [Geodermatophilus tzadiensis]|uniref:AAA ATPase-like protein n=1 Tax=Geodermatophilus tzadiensis TaxID=1137988 RepID=A0A2T0TTP3_9ACTN|nr:AAA ATPase-like protein [Geodermatophilus tzadiensis]
MLRGEAGIGKTALLNFMLERTAGCRVVRAAGVESEMELAYASLHQLCSPLLGRLDGLPGPQQEALATAFGLRSGGAPDRFLVGLAVLTLLSSVAEDRPLICVVDDAQWLDQATLQALEFVARRLAAEPIAMVFALRGSDHEPRLTGLPELVVRGLGMRDAATLLESTVNGVLDARVRTRILAESRGNPLALLELPRGHSTADLAFGGDVEEVAPPLARRLEHEFLRQVDALPTLARRLLLVAAAEPVGDVLLLWRAAERLGIDADTAAAAEDAGLLQVRERTRFRHPLVRSAVYRAATDAERRQVHAALAEVTDPEADPDRRAWHRACAAVGPDEAVAAELERSADRAQAKGGLAAAAAFLERAVILTPEPLRRARRSIDAAQAKVSAGAFAAAARLLTTAEMGPLGEAERARIEVLRARLSFAADRGNEALPLLLTAARRLERIDATLARDTYLDALAAALFAGRLAAGPGAHEVARAARAAPALPQPRKGDLLLDGLAVLHTDGYDAAVPLLQRAVSTFAREDLTVDEGLRFAWLAAATTTLLWDDSNWDRLSRRHLDFARQSGGLSALPLALNTRIVVHLFTGDLDKAAFLVEELRSVTEATGNGLAPYGEVGLLALRGDPEVAEPFIQSCLDDVVTRGEGVGVNMTAWARAVLCNGLGRYDDALRWARVPAAQPLETGIPQWALAELVEAGMRSGDVAAAAVAQEQLTAMATASGTDWALGVRAAREALLRRGPAADELYREAITRLDRTLIRSEQARARLLYGEWLRREGRRVEALAQLRAAHEALQAMGAQAFAARARQELQATGEAVRRSVTAEPAELTPQELHIARLAAQGLTNTEIAAMLFISARTVEWHLRKVFTKLGLTTRRELRRSLPAVDDRAVSAAQAGGSLPRARGPRGGRPRPTPS